ncbi:MAG TPA: hypothetical protein VN878_00680 [Usitatibacter sp.]|nr:hypothetical protein [Usitatibacter sp.]
MPSELRRAAKALVEHKSESFESRHCLEESQARLAAVLAAAVPTRAIEVRWEWKVEGGRVRLQGDFAPAPRTQRFLKTSSGVLALLIAATVWAFLSPEEERIFKFLMPLTTLLAVLGFPLLAAALGSQREAEEARVCRAIRRALVDEAKRV